MRHLHHSPLLPLSRRLFRPSPPRLWRRVPWLSLLALLLLTALLSACSSPPALPTVDDSQRRPANSPAAIALQTCQSDLHNSAHPGQRAATQRRHGQRPRRPPSRPASTARPPDTRADHGARAQYRLRAALRLWQHPPRLGS